jgi:hypothetical protein
MAKVGVTSTFILFPHPFLSACVVLLPGSAVHGQHRGTIPHLVPEGFEVFAVEAIRRDVVVQPIFIWQEG